MFVDAAPDTRHPQGGRFSRLLWLHDAANQVAACPCNLASYLWVYRFGYRVV